MSGRFLLVGLGNPGPKYAGNRHNIGFMAADVLARVYGLSGFRSRFQGEIAAGTIDGHDVLLLKPSTFMNESGRSVGEAARFHKILPEATYVLHDELDLTAGKVRIKRGGGAAGHNGLRSIDAHIGADYWRIRLGIGHPGDKRRVLGHVLDNFDGTDKEWLDPVLTAVARYAPLLLAGDDGAFMSKVAMATSDVRSRTAAESREGSGSATDSSKRS